MWQSYLNGMLVAFGLIMAIGAQNAFVLAQSLRREHHLPVAALCIVCDAILVAAGVFGLATVLAHNPTLLAIARWGGAVFLIWYGAKALRSACSKQSLQHQQGQGVRSRRAVLLSALAVTLLNPHVYLDTVLLIGSLGAQQSAPGAYVAGAASASLLWFSTCHWRGVAGTVAGAAGDLAHARPDGGGDDVRGGGTIDLQLTSGLGAAYSSPARSSDARPHWQHQRNGEPLVGTAQPLRNLYSLCLLRGYAPGPVL